MGAWPEGLPTGLTHFGPLSPLGGINTELVQNVGWGWNATFTVLSTNARFFPFVMTDNFVPYNVSLLPGTIAPASMLGAWTIAIVDETGKRMCTTAATSAVNSTYQTATFTTTPLLPPGSYYVGWQVDVSGSTSLYICTGTQTVSKMRSMGCRSSTTVLGATNTLVAYSDATQIPLMVLTGLVNT